MSARRILVVDDSSLIRSVLRSFLVRMEGFSMSFAKNGRDALEFIEREGEPNLILLDINMPVMNGLEFLNELTARGGVQKRIPVVIVSTEGKEQDILRGLEAGARAYLRKPFTVEELRDIVGRVIQN